MNKPIVAYDGFDGSIVAIYYSIESAAEDNQLSTYQLRQLLNSGTKYNRRYFGWFYYEDYEEPDADDKFPIQQLEAGVVVNRFYTMSEASARLGISRNKIANLITNGGIDQWGCSWKNLRKAFENL